MTMKHKIVLSFLFALGAVANAPHAAQAAQDAGLYLTPATAVFPVGEPFTVEVRIRNTGGSIGTADATVGYEPSDLEFVSFSSDGSIFASIIVPETNERGRVKVQGVVSHGRSWSGEDGLFATLTFRPLRSTATELRFMQGAATPLMAAVGASNVLSRLGAATYTLVPKEMVPAPAAVIAATPAQEGSIEITPLPLPDDGWFGTTSVKLAWSLPQSVTEMRTILSDKPVDTPSKLYPVPVSSVLLDGLAEGTNYFHMQWKQEGVWGPVTRYPIKVDLTPPEHVIVTEADRTDPTDPRAAFVIDSADLLSGISSYLISIDNDEPEVWEKSKDELYRPQGLTPGSHLITVTARDRAGNTKTAELEFLVRSLDPPTMTRSPDHVLAGNQITIEGTTYPNAEVTTYISFKDGEATEKKVRSDASGAFIVTLTEEARPGKYTIWFSVADERGAVSPPSIKRSVTVTQPYIMLFGSTAVTYMSVIVPLVGLILLLGLILWLLYTYVRGYRARVRRETDQAYRAVQDEFSNLEQDMVKQIGVLEQANHARKLTREELRILTELREKLNKIQEHISSEIDDIEPVAHELRVPPKRQREESALARVRETQPSKRTITIERVR